MLLKNSHSSGGINTSTNMLFLFFSLLLKPSPYFHLRLASLHVSDICCCSCHLQSETKPWSWHLKIWTEQLPLISDILIGLCSFLWGTIYPEETCQHVWEAHSKPHINMTNHLNNNNDQRAVPSTSVLRWKTPAIPPGKQQSWKALDVSVPWCLVDGEPGWQEQVSDMDVALSVQQALLPQIDPS